MRAVLVRPSNSTLVFALIKSMPSSEHSNFSTSILQNISETKSADNTGERTAPCSVPMLALNVSFFVVAASKV